MKKSSVCSTLIVVLFVLLLSIVTISAITGSNRNARMILYPEVDGIKETVLDQTILVKNVNSVPIKVTTKIGDDVDFIELIDTEVVLQPDEDYRLKFKVKVKDEGTYEANINVFYNVAEGDEPGVVIPSTIIVVAKKNQDFEEPYDSDESNSRISLDGTIEKVKSLPLGALFLALMTLILIIVLVVLFNIQRKKGKKEVFEEKKSVKEVVKEVKNEKGNGKKK